MAARGRQVADAYIEVHGDLSPFRRDLNKARAAMIGANKDMEQSNARSWTRINNVTGAALRKIQTSWRRMDSTVRLVIGLVAAAGDQVATIGSGLSAVVTAIASSLGMAMGSIVPIVAGLTAMGVAAALAATSFEDMMKRIPAIKEALDGISKTWGQQADAFGRAWEDEISSLLTSFDKQFAKYDFGKPLGDAAGVVAEAFEKVVNGPAFKAFMTAMTDELPDSVAGFGTGFANVMSAVLSTLAGAAPAARALGEDFAKWGAGLRDAAEAARESGVMEEVFAKSRESLLAVLDLTGSLGKALGRLFMLGADHGNALLDTMTSLVDRFYEWMGTTAGMEAMNKWFEDGIRIIKAMEPAVVGLARAMQILVTEDSIQRWIGLNEAIGRLLPSLAEVLHIIGNLDILTHLTNIVTAFTDAITIMGGPLMQIAQLIDGVLSAAISNFSDLLAGVAAAMVGPLEAAVPGLQAVGAMVVSVMEPLVDNVVKVAQIMGTALTPVIETLSQTLTALIIPVTNVADVFLGAILSALNALSPSFDVLSQVLTSVARIFGDLAMAAMPLVTLLAEVFASALAQIVPLINQVVTAFGDALLPILNDLSVALASAGPEIANLAAQFLSGLGPALDSIGPLISSLGEYFMALLPALMQVGEALGGALVTALNAILPAVMSLLPVIIDVATAFVDLAAGALPVVADLLSGLIGAVTPLIPIIVNLAANIAKLALTFIGELLPALGPILAALGESLMSVVTAIAPILVDLAGTVAELATVFIGQLLPALLPIITTLVGALAPAITALAPVIAQIVGVVAELAVTFLSALLPAILPLLPVILQLIETIAGLLVPAIELIGSIISAVMPVVQAIVEGVIGNVIGLIEGIVTVISGVVNVIQGIFTGDWAMIWQGVQQIVSGAVQAVWNFINLWIIGRVVQGIKLAMTAVKGTFTTVWNAIKSFFSTTINAIKNTATTVFNAIKSSITSIINAIKSTITSVWNGIKSVTSTVFNAIKSAIQNAMNTVRSIVSSVVNAVKSFFTSAFNSAKSIVSSAMSGIKNSVQQGINNVVSFVRGLPGKAAAALGGIGSRLISAGADLIRGFIQGVKNMAGNIAQAALDAVGNAVNAVKNFLGIRSPSRLFMQIGEFTGEGMAIGIDHTKKAVLSAAQAMAETATSAFSQSKMRIAGLDAAQGLADGLIANKGAVAGALSGLNTALAPDIDKIGKINVRSKGSTQYAGEGDGAGRGLYVAPGAVQVNTPTKNPELVANKVIDGFADFSTTL